MMKNPSWLAVFCALLLCGTAEAAELRVLSTRATEELYRELVPRFERTSGHKVTTAFTGTLEVQKRIAAGERYDVIIMLDTAIDDYIAAGKVVPGSRVDIARSVIGVGVRAGLPKPNIGSVAALKQALLSARSIAYSTGPSGTYVIDMFAKLGIAGTVGPKLKQIPSDTLVATALARGDADLGFHQANELSHHAGVDYLGPLPAELQEPTWRSGAIMAGAQNAVAGKALLEFISGPAAAPVIRKHGLEPRN